MHPAIRSFPADHFYDRRLVDADVVMRNARRTPGTLGQPGGHAGHAAGDRLAGSRPSADARAVLPSRDDGDAPRAGPPGFLAASAAAPATTFAPPVADRRLAPYLFYNLRGSVARRDGRGHSLYNTDEAVFCSRLLTALRLSQVFAHRPPLHNRVCTGRGSSPATSSEVL